MSGHPRCRPPPPLPLPLPLPRPARRPGTQARSRQQGAALVCALALMLAVMLIGVSVCRAVFASIASAAIERERGLAHAAAEAALRDAERDIGAASPGASPAQALRAAHFLDPGAAGFVDGCGQAGPERGLCRASTPPAWQRQDLAAPDNPALVPYGHFTGASMATGAGLLPARLPAYLVEKLAPPGAGAGLGSFYRITAIGFGSRDATRVVLQAVVRKPLPAPSGAGPPPSPPAPPSPAGPPAAPPTTLPPTTLPAGRIGWREVANWAQLHAQAAASLE